MQTINVLSQQLINQIAAGEVIERPASVVKELIENAIDAQATSIHITLHDGGTTYIRIQDNGKGMSKQDLAVCTLPHTTSKIKQSDDLFAITTLGFRGEALASIQSVSRMVMYTNKSQGLKKIDDTITPIGTPPGTIIEVKDLFYNIPARKKYMKTPATELRKCMEYIHQYALCYPHIQFSCIHNKQTLLEAAPSTQLQRIAYILGQQEMLEIPTYTHHNITVQGYTSPAHVYRKDRRLQFFFVNKRCVQSTVLQSAVYRAYDQIIHHGLYPLCVLHITIDPKLIDVNVHPAKATIRFEDEQAIFKAVYHAIRPKVETQHIQRIDAHTLQKPSQQHLSHTIQEQHKSSNQTSSQHPLHNASQNVTHNISQHRPHIHDKPTMYESTQQQAFPQTSQTMRAYRIIGVFTKKYVLLEQGTHLLIVDFHAAFERKNFEELKTHYKQGFATQQLLKPEILPMDIKHMLRIQQVLEHIQSIGFDIEIFGEQSVMIRKVPLIGKKTIPASFVHEFLSYYQQHTKDPWEQLVENVLARMACRMSYMAGDTPSFGELYTLCDDILTGTIPKTCPHGRPVIVTLDEKTLDKLFLRSL
ncbi:MAG: DNA mismatch repair endonuclease MutL [Candidatus Woesearchaeota archaeon]